MAKIIFFCFFILGCTYIVDAQIHFIESISLDNAKHLAAVQGKNIFIDTYADWCIPCKKMEIEFRNTELAAFFNDNYINVKIDMDDSSFAPEYRKQFDVVFLPTMVILDSDGHVKYKTDKLIPGRELLYIAQQTLDPSIYFTPDASEVQRNPMQANNNSMSQGPSKVIFASDELAKANPDFLYKEAYFRIELMDGSHYAVADRYLATQVDWLTEKNVRFILDFTDNFYSKKCQFVVDNIEAIRKIVDQQQITLSLGYLINNRLTSGYPRPDLQESIKLFKVLYPDNYTEYAYDYYIDRLIHTCNYKELLETISAHPSNENLSATLLTYKFEALLAMNKCEDECDDLLLDLLNIDNKEAFYHGLLGDYYQYLGQTKKARKAYKEANLLSKEAKQPGSYYESMLQKI